MTYTSQCDGNYDELGALKTQDFVLLLLYKHTSMSLVSTTAK